MSVSLAEIARVLGGNVCGHQVLAPGPGHSRCDQSLSVRLSPTSRDGFIVYSHAGDDWRTCREYVAAALGISNAKGRQDFRIEPAEVARRSLERREAEERYRTETLRRQRQAVSIWQEGRDPRGTIVESYLRSRGLNLPKEIAGEVLRLHPCCPWEGSTVPAMVAPLRCIYTSQILGVHRTALDADGRKLGRKMLGTAAGTAIMLDPEDAVSVGLTIGEGIETCLAARQLGLAPVWALGSVGAVASFPVLPGIETLTVLAEAGDSGASTRACEEIGVRWTRAGCSVDILTPRWGNDFNDVVMGRWSIGDEQQA